MLQLMDREAVGLALSLAEGVALGDAGADDLLLDAFDSVEDAARAHAYLAGFLLQVVAAERQEPVSSSTAHMRRLLGRT
jgi:hypothetical protein